MMAEKPLLALTSKGRDELKTRVHRLDPMSRNILFLVDKGNATVEALQQRSLFPPTTLRARLPQLIAEGFMQDAAADATGSFAAAPADSRPLDALQMQPGASASQARFELCDFCLDHFGTRSQGLVDSINRCTDLKQVQQVLDRIQSEVRQNFPDRLTALIACVASINESAA